MIEFEDEIEGKPVTVYAKGFGEDRSVGIELHPEEIWAEDEEGNTIDLMDDESMEDELVRLSQLATDCYVGQEDDILIDEAKRAAREGRIDE